MRSTGVLVGLGVASAAVYAVGFDLPLSGRATRVFGALYYPLFAAYLAAAWWVWRRPGIHPGVVVAFALAFRLFAAADPPSLSSDLHRYPWDGRVQRAGLSPYVHAPEDPALTPLRDAVIHPRINRPAERTVYPPGSQALFALLPYDIDAVRWIMIGFDLVTILLLIALLRRLELDPARVVLYAWAPLSVYEIANNGHVEAAVLPLLVGAVLVYRSRRWTAAGLMVGAAAAMKLYPVLLAAAFERRRLLGIGAVAAAVVATLYGAYLVGAGDKVLGFLPRYVGVAEDHNIGLRAALEWPLALVVSRPRALAFGLCLAALAIGVILVVRWDAPPELKALTVAGLYVATLPTAFHPWYALWLLPWLCFHPRAAWLWLTAALPLSYLEYGAPGDVMPAWVVPLEWIPTAALLLADRLPTSLGRFRRASC